MSDVADRNIRGASFNQHRVGWPKMDKPPDIQPKANPLAVAEMLDLLRGINTACDDVKHGDTLKAMRILEAVQDRLADLITVCARQGPMPR
jgi:hypothetical protein